MLWKYRKNLHIGLSKTFFLYKNIYLFESLLQLFSYEAQKVSNIWSLSSQERLGLGLKAIIRSIDKIIKFIYTIAYGFENRIK